MSAPDYDGCRRDCRKAGQHTLVWGACEHAVEPAPTLSYGCRFTAADGHPAFGIGSITVTDLATRIEAVLRDAWSQPHARIATAARAIAEDLTEMGADR